MKNNESHYHLGELVFTGENASRDFLNPARIPKQVLEFRGPVLNPFADKGVVIYGDLLLYTNFMQSKLIAVSGILEALSLEGKLAGTDTLCIASSGNSAWALAVLAKFFNVPHVFAVVPDGVPEAKINAIKAAGAGFATTSRDGESAIEKAKRLSGEQKGWLYFDQYGHRGNPEAFKIQAQKLWDQLGGSMTMAVVAVGTGGTVGGYGLELGPRSVNSSHRAELVGVITDDKGGVPGARSERQLSEVQFVKDAGGLESWTKQTVDELVGGISMHDAVELSTAILQEAGVPAGYSSGLALAGAHKSLERRIKDGTLGKLRNSDGKVVVTVTCPDPFHFYTGNSILLAQALDALAQRREKIKAEKK